MLSEDVVADFETKRWPMSLYFWVTLFAQPMLEHVRIHPELVTGTKDHELDPTRLVGLVGITRLVS